MHFNTITSTIALLAATVAGAPTLEENMSLIDLARRQTSNPCSQWTPQTRIVGDGSPKDKVLWKQVTGKIECGDTDTCSIQAGEYESWSIGADLGGGSTYITGGLSVQKTWETGTAWTCEEKEDNFTCLWVKIPHTEYEVQSGSYNSCGGFSGGKKYRISSPKSGGDEVHRCSSSDCRSEGAQYWE